jgi:hypothetical protein
MGIPSHPVEIALLLLVMFALGILLGRALKRIAAADADPSDS